VLPNFVQLQAQWYHTSLKNSLIAGDVAQVRECLPRKPRPWFSPQFCPKKVVYKCTDIEIYFGAEDVAQ
jgi:hypothetical protein